MTIRATRRVTHYDQTLCEKAETNDPLLTVVVAPIFSFERWPREDMHGVREVQPALDQRQISLGKVVGETHPVIVNTKTSEHNDQRLAT